MSREEGTVPHGILDTCRQRTRHSVYVFRVPNGNEELGIICFSPLPRHGFRNEPKPISRGRRRVSRKDLWLALDIVSILRLGIVWCIGKESHCCRFGRNEVDNARCLKAEDLEMLGVVKVPNEKAQEYL